MLTLLIYVFVATLSVFAEENDDLPPQGLMIRNGMLFDPRSEAQAMQATYDWRYLQKIPYQSFRRFFPNALGRLDNGMKHDYSSQLGSLMEDWVYPPKTIPFPEVLKGSTWPLFAKDMIQAFNAIYEVVQPDDTDEIQFMSVIINTFNYFNTLYIMNTNNAGNLEKGYTGCFDIPSHSSSFFFYVQGSFQRFSSNEDIEIRMPRVLMGSVPKNKLKGKAYFPCEYDAFREFGNPPFVSKMGSGFVASQSGIEPNPQLVLQISKTSVDLISLNGQKNAMPFAISQKTHLAQDVPQTAEAYQAVISLPNSSGERYFKPDETYCFAMPETDADMDVLELLLDQLKNIEDNALKIQQMSVMEEIEENETQVSSPKVSQEAKRQLNENARRVEQEQREAAKKQRIREAEEAAIRTIEQEITEKEVYDAQVKREQAAVSQRVAQAAATSASSKKKGTAAHSQKGVTLPPQVEEPQETDEAKGVRIRALAEARFKTKKASLRACLESF